MPGLLQPDETGLLVEVEVEGPAPTAPVPVTPGRLEPLLIPSLTQTLTGGTT